MVVASDHAHIRLLELARECAALGASKTTIAHLTGLEPRFILTKVYDKACPAPLGRSPYTEDFYFRNSLRVQAEVNAFATKLQQLIEAGFSDLDAMLSAYRHHTTCTQNPAFTFDEGFYLLCQLEGRMACDQQSVQLQPCLTCGSQHVVTVGDTPREGCPICRLVAMENAGRQGSTTGPGQAHSRSHHPLRRPIRPPVEIQQHIDALRLQLALVELGAHPRVMQAVLSSVPTPHFYRKPAAPRQPVHAGKPLNLKRWSQYLKPSVRAQFSISALMFHRLERAGFPHPDALLASYRHLESLVSTDLVPVDRCFEVVSQSHALWGVKTPTLDLVPCGSCGSYFLMSRAETHEAMCPFCVMKRFPRLFEDVPRQELEVAPHDLDRAEEKR